MAEATQERRLLGVGSTAWFGWGGCPLSGPLPCPCALLLEHLVRQEEERRGKRDPERLCGLAVEDQLELRGLLHG